MVLRPSNNAKPSRTLATRHCLVDIRGVMHHQIIPKQYLVVIYPLHSKLLNLRANLVTKVPKDVECFPHTLDTPNPTLKMLNTPTDLLRKCWIPRLDGKKDSDLGTVVIMPIFPYPENPQRPPPCSVSLLQRDPKLINVNQLLPGHLKNPKWGRTVPKAPDMELDMLSLSLVGLC